MTDTMTTFTSVPVAGNREACVVIAPTDIEGEAAVAALELPPPRALVVLNGTTAELEPGVRGVLASSLGDGLAKMVEADGVTCLTGATDAGIFTLFGEAVGQAGPTAPLVGVAPLGCVTWPGRREAPADAAPLELHHTHFLLVEANEWGTETAAMIDLAAALGTNAPSVAVLAGGGAVAKREALGHVRAGRALIVLAGSGRLADQIATAASGAGSGDAGVSEVARSGLAFVHDIGTESPSALASLVRARLAAAGGER